MLVTRYNPNMNINEFRRGFNLINSMLDDLGQYKTLSNTNKFTPSINTREGEFAYHIEVDLPGVTKEDIDIKVEDGILAISAIRKYKNELTRDDYYICESSFGKFERRYALPESVDTSKVDAKLVDGRLIVELQKTKKAQPRVISIK